MRSLAVIELSRLSCWSVVASNRPPPPAPEHTEEELSTASPSASSTSLSIKSLCKKERRTLVSTGARSKPKRLLYHLRYTRIAAVLFLPKAVLLYKVVEALRLFPHVVKRHAFRYASCCNLGENAQKNEWDVAFYPFITVSSAQDSLCVSVWGGSSCHTSVVHVQSSCILHLTKQVIFLKSKQRYINAWVNLSTVNWISKH